MPEGHQSLVKVVTNVLEGGSLTSRQSKSEIRIAKKRSRYYEKDGKEKICMDPGSAAFCSAAPCCSARPGGTAGRGDNMKDLSELVYQDFAAGGIDPDVYSGLMSNGKA